MCMRAAMKAARTTVAAATTSEAARRWRSRKKRYASMVLRENIGPSGCGCRAGAVARKDDVPVVDGGHEAAGADREALAGGEQAHAAQPHEALLLGQLARRPGLAAVGGRHQVARVPHHHAVLPDHDDVVEAGVLERLQAAQLVA